MQPLANECKICECYQHATSCVYDVDAAMGMCINCMHNTQEAHCDSCIDFYYKRPGVPLDSPDVCQPCNCHPPGVTDEGDCQRGDNVNNSDSGQCNCKEFVTGRACDMCISTYFNLSGANPQGCEACLCNENGTNGSSKECDSENGQCPCKPNVVGMNCSSCALDHYGLELEGGCLPCHEQCEECTGPGPTECLVSGGLHVAYLSVIT